jgi:mono/diheme cytochrome c family protein
MALRWLACVGTVLLSAGCASSYVAPPAARGGDIFADACARCHSPLEGRRDVYFALAPTRRSAEFVATKVRKGGMRMPAYPNLTDDQVRWVAEYAVSHSVEKTD